MSKSLFGTVGALLFMLLASLSNAAPAKEVLDAAAINAGMSPGINYGNILEADPPEGWGLTAKEGDFKIIAAAGFKGVRLPVRFNAKAATVAPYTVEPAFFQKVDRMVNAAMSAGLTVVLDFHHYNEIFEKPAAHRERFLAIWTQVARRYSRHSRKLLFEILNEPHDKLTPELWNAYYMDALAIIRKENADRVIVIGPAAWGGVEAMQKLKLPKGDSNVIFSFHDYSPFHFTHQGAEWVGKESKAWLGTKWTGTPKELKEMEADFEKVKKYAAAHRLPVILGEFGAISKGDMPSRVRWTTAMSSMAKKYSYSRFYWEFKADGFGAYDEAKGKWRDELKDAIVK